MVAISKSARWFAATTAFVLVAAACGTNKDKSTTSSTAPKVDEVSCDELEGEGDLPITFGQAKEGGCEAEFDWGANCDTETGRLKLPTAAPLQCVPAFSADNGGATSSGVAADTIKIARYVGPSNPALDAYLRSIGAADEPEQIQQTYDDLFEMYNAMAELYGRKVEVVRLEGSGDATNAVAARADALKAKELGVFAVIGGPAQTRAFSEELARYKIINVGGAVGSGAFYKNNAPYVWAGGPSPEQTAQMATELIEKQLAGKKAEFAGDEFTDEVRRFVLLTYDDAENNFKEPWDDWLADLQAKDIDVADERIVFTLDLARTQEDTQIVVRKLREVNATTVVFTGDPLMPGYFSAEMTKQGYFPEWVLAGTVFADTTVLARGYDQEQWKHTVGISVLPARIPQEQSDTSVIYKWWTGDDIPASNTGGIIAANLALLFSGLHFAGPNLTPETFRDGIYARPRPDRVEGDIRGEVTYGRDDIWPAGTDSHGLDDVAILWWDPEAGGEDETGTTGKPGQYRYVNGGERFAPGEIPTEPIAFFDPEGTVTYYSDEPDAPEGTLPVPDYVKTNPDKYERPST